MGRTYKLTGGDKLGKALELIAAKAKDSVVVRVGFPEGGTEPDGQPTALIAFLNEFGKTVRSKEGDYYQLPRPFFRNMIAKCSKDWPEQLAKALKASDYGAVKALSIMGEEMASALKESINELQDPPLAPSTIKKKKFSINPSKPLIDSSTMSKAPVFWISED